MFRPNVANFIHVSIDFHRPDTDQAIDEFWIGYYDHENVGSTHELCSSNGDSVCRSRFEWVDGTPVNEGMPMWSSSEPNPGDYCARLSDRGKLRGSSCTTQRRYVCSRGKCAKL